VPPGESEKCYGPSDHDLRHFANPDSYFIYIVVACLFDSPISEFDVDHSSLVRNLE